MGWLDTSKLGDPRGWTCGYRGAKVAGDAGYQRRERDGFVLPCPRCDNHAAHEIVPVTDEQARNVLDFVTMLLRLAYEFPARLAPRR